jgi:hypothetical protein
MAYVTDEQLFPRPREPRNIWERTGFTAAQRRRIDASLLLLLAVFVAGWIYSAALAMGRGDSPNIARRLATAPTPLSQDAPPPTAFLLDAALERMTADLARFRGESGALHVVIPQTGDSLALPDTLAEGVDVVYGPAERSGAVPVDRPSSPGIWNLMLQVRDAVRSVPRMSVVTLVPASEASGGRIGSYRIGSWPARVSGVPNPDRYRPPEGFIRVTPENQNLRVSEHFLLREFVTKGQENVWPKYVVLSPRMLDKAELTIQELEAAGHPVERVGVISGFRTPSYNASGGDTGGRGALSRHMYGDAVDFFIDNDGDFRMDDLNGDGRVTIADARVMAAAAERVEQKHPNLIGGIGVYAPTGAHSGFIHVDTRGYRARW